MDAFAEVHLSDAGWQLVGEILDRDGLFEPAKPALEAGDVHGTIEMLRAQLKLWMRRSDLPTEDFRASNGEWVSPFQVCVLMFYASAIVNRLHPLPVRGDHLIGVLQKTPART